MIYITNVDLVNGDEHTNFGLILSISSQEKPNTNLDLVTDNVYTNFGLILSIRSQDIEQKPNSDINQGP